MQQIGPQGLDESRYYQLVLTGAATQDSPYGTSLAEHFTGSEVLTAVLWPGLNYPVSATLTATWDSSLVGNPATLANPVVNLAVLKSAISALDAGTYQCRVVADAGTVDELLWRGEITLIASPGSTAVPRVYCSYQDLLDECAWLPTIAASDNARAAQFLPERVQASQWVEQQAMARWRRAAEDQYRRHGAVLWVAPIIPTTGVDGGPVWGDSSIPNTTLMGAESDFATLLDTVGLMTAYPPDRRRLQRLTALYALSLALDDASGTGPGDTSVQEMAKKYRKRAVGACLSTVFRVDADSNGVPDFELRY